MRRLKLAAALVLMVGMAAAGVLVGRAVTGTRAAAGTGIVTGHLAACFAIAPSTKPWPVTPGTVVVLRGRVSWKPDGPGAWQLVYPKGPAVASEHISDNYGQMFRFALSPGHYVLAGRYDYSPGHGPFKEVTVTAGRVSQVNLPNMCM